MELKRQSGIELLRIIAMFLVLVQHVNGIAIGLPGSLDCVNAPLNSWLRFFLQSMAIVGVDVFVLISGWFGIRFRIKRLAEFIFQCLFFSVLVSFVIWLFQGRPSLDAKTILGAFFLGKSYWFVKSYLLLYVISPVLNAFIESSTKSTARLVIGLFLGIMFVYGWSDSMPEFNFGCSAISFIGLYLLARYLKLYGDGICSRSVREYGCFYVMFSLILSSLCLLLIRSQAPVELTRCIFSFDNPLVIAGALSLVLLFARLDISSSFINRVARSAFSVYLLHCGPFAWTLFLSASGWIYHTYDGVCMASLMIAFLIGVFTLSCVLDQARIVLWARFVDRKCE